MRLTKRGEGRPGSWLRVSGIRGGLPPLAAIRLAGTLRNDGRGSSKHRVSPGGVRTEQFQMSHDTSRARVSAEAPLELRRESGRLETPRRLVDRLTQALSELGVEHAFGLIGGANAPFVDALGRSAIHVTHCRHEGGAAFAATEASLVSGRPALVFATTGPGILNALNGLAAARW